jgi:hypothetical protein
LFTELFIEDSLSDPLSTSLFRFTRASILWDDHFREVSMAAKAYKASANFPSLGDEAHQEVLVEAGSWAAAIGLAARKLKALPALKRKQIKSCTISLQLTDSSPAKELDSSAGTDEAVEQPEG